MRRFVGVILGVLGVTIAAAVGLAVPPQAPPAVEAGPTASVARACPSFGASLAEAFTAVVADGGELASSPLPTPSARTALANPAVFATGAEPERITAPLGATVAATVAVRAADGPERGLSVASCQVPQNDFWFVGVRSHADAQSEVQLVNLDNVPAEVNITVLGAQGRLASPGSRGLVVAARATRTVSLGPLIDAAEPVTLHVEAPSGRVAAFVRERRYEGVLARGAEWVAPSAAPAQLAIVMPVPGGPGPRDMIVANPGDRVVQVEVEMLGATGSYRATGVETLEVPGESTRLLRLDLGLQGTPVTLRVTSTRPVAVALEARSEGDSATTDRSHHPAGEPLGAGTAFATVALPSAGRAIVTVANPTATDATPTIVLRGPDGAERLRREVPVPAGSSVELEEVEGADPVLEVVTAVPGLHASLTVTMTVGAVGGFASLPVGERSAGTTDVRVEHDPRVGT